MTEEQVKFICKYCVENGNRQLSNTQKEILKQAIDQAQNIQQLFEVVMISKLFDQ